MNSMRSALVGYTGFVGSTLTAQTTFTDLYNSKNSHALRGEHFDLLVCAAAPAAKWQANQNPEADLHTITTLIETLKTTTAKECVLISTVDVYGNSPFGNEETIIDQTQLHAYGKHRLLLESELTQQFDKLTICRLPALFGTGLKKNFIFDLIYQPSLNFTHPESSFQFYPMQRLWSDIEIARSAKLPIVNLVTEPLQAATIASAVDGRQLTPPANSQPIHYDLHTLHAKTFNGHHGYLQTAQTTLKQVVNFIKTAQTEITT